MINSTVVFAKTCLALVHYLILFNPFVQSVVKKVAIEFATNIQQKYAPVNLKNSNGMEKIYIYGADSITSYS